MKLQDFQISKCTSHVHVPFAASWSQDNIVAMVTEVGVYLMEMTPTPFNKSPTLDIHRYIVFPSDSNPTFDSGIPVDDLTRELSEEELYQIVQDITLAPHIKGAHSAPTVKQVGWSPMRITHNMRSMLTILTDSGGLDLYCLTCNNWKHLLSISNHWRNLCKAEWEPNVGLDTPKAELLRMLKERTYKVKITAFAWGEMHPGQVPWCPLFIGTMDGTIIVWKVNQEPSTITIELMSLVVTNLGHITALNNTLINQAHYLLFCAALNGRIQSHVVCLLDKAESAALVGQTYETWAEEDRIEMPAGSLVSSNWPNRVILAVAKGPSLLLFLNNTQGTVICHCVVNSNNLSITGVCFSSPEHLLMTTTEGFIYVVTIRLDFNGFLQTQFTMIESTMQFDNYRCNGFALSNSKAILCMAYSFQGSYDHLQLREYSQAVWCSLMDMDDAVSTINNHLGSLYDIWDIFELIRIQCIKKNWTDKILTISNIEELDVMDVIKLKKNLWYVEISLKLDSNSNESKKTLLTLRDEMTTLIMSSHVFKRVTQLMSTADDEITEFDQESLKVMRQWLFHLVNVGLKASYTATHATASTLLQQVDDTIDEEDKNSELCSICGAHVEAVEDTSTSLCVQGHSVPRCFLSMLQCGVLPYYMCPVCKVVAHPSAVTVTSSTCVFCDYHLRLDEKISTLHDLNKEDNNIFFG